MHADGLIYAAGVIHLNERLIAYDHCTLKGSIEYLRIKGKDLTLVSHPDYPNGVVYAPFLDTNLGLFVLKPDKKFAPDNFGSFCEWAQDIISRLDEQDSKKIDTLFLPCFKYER